MPESAWGLYTRAVDPWVEETAGEATGEEGQQQRQVVTTVVNWDERFVLKLPVELSEQLLCPAPGDNQFDGVPLQVRS